MSLIQLNLWPKTYLKALHLNTVGPLPVDIKYKDRITIKCEVCNNVTNRTVKDAFRLGKFYCTKPCMKPTANWLKVLDTGIICLDPYKGDAVPLKVSCNNCLNIIEKTPRQLLRSECLCNLCANEAISKRLRETYNLGPAPRWFITRYHNVIKRCTNPDHHNYSRYGGRGIECKFASCEEFWDHVKDLPYCSKDMTLDRIDNDKHYEPDNIRWASMKTQSRNTRTTAKTTTGIRPKTLKSGKTRYNVYLDYNGKTRHIGVFDTFEEAYAKREEYKKIYWCDDD